MAENPGKEKMNRLVAAASKANGLTKAAFMLASYEKVTSEIGTIGADHCIQALNENKWKYLLELFREFYITAEQFDNFAEFLPKLPRASAMEILRYKTSFDGEPLFVEACKFAPIPYKILSNKKLNTGDIDELIHMKDMNKIMVFPKLLDANANKYVLDNRPQFKRMQLFDEYVNSGEKAFFHLRYNQGFIQRDELLRMPASKKTHDFLVSAVSDDNTRYYGASVLSMLDIDYIMHIMLGMRWSPKQLAGLCLASAGSTFPVFFTLDNKTTWCVLDKLTPKLRSKIVFSDQNIEKMKDNIGYCKMLVDTGLFQGKELKEIEEYKQVAIDADAACKEEWDKKEEEEKAQRELSLAGNYTNEAHKVFTQKLLKSRVSQRGA
jgi:hypothetical protein